VFCVLIKNLIIPTAIPAPVPCRNNKQFRKLTVCFPPPDHEITFRLVLFVLRFLRTPKNVGENFEKAREKCGTKSLRNRKQICILNIFLMKFQYIHALLPCGDMKNFFCLGLENIECEESVNIKRFFQQRNREKFVFGESMGKWMDFFLGE
jgi:hypothetical protein